MSESTGDRYDPAKIETRDSGRVIEYRGRMVVTKRQLQVLNLILDGKSNAEIEEHLQCSMGTVKAHVGRILARFDVETRLQLVVKIRKEEFGR